jgi:NAD(P)H-nitrite reductase large subunit
MNNCIDWEKEPGETLVCFCSKVDKSTIENAIKNGAHSVQELQSATNAGVGGRCKELNPRGRCCHPDIKELLKIYGK